MLGLPINGVSEPCPARRRLNSGAGRELAYPGISCVAGRSVAVEKCQLRGLICDSTYVSEHKAPHLQLNVVNRTRRGVATQHHLPGADPRRHPRRGHCRLVSTCQRQIPGNSPCGGHRRLISCRAMKPGHIFQNGLTRSKTI